MFSGEVFAEHFPVIGGAQLLPECLRTWLAVKRFQKGDGALSVEYNVELVLRMNGDARQAGNFIWAVYPWRSPAVIAHRISQRPQKALTIGT